MTVVNKAGSETRYTLQGINAGNAPTRGYAIENVGSVTSPDLAHYAGHVYGDTYSVDEMMRGAAVDPDTNYPTTEALYLFESPKANETFVIIKGEFNGVVGYHRLNLWDRKTETYYDITRNYHYIVSVNKIATAGYRTAQEAIAARASNRDVNYDIIVTDPYSHDIVSNGEQYLAVSNSALRIYQTGAMSNVVAAVLNYTVPNPGENTWSTGSITPKGTGLTIVGANNGTKLDLPLSDMKNREIKVNLASGFTSGSLEIRIGDLAKVIAITKSDNLPAVADEMEFDDCVVGDRTNSGSMRSSIRFTDESGMYQDKDNFNNIYTGSTGKLYALVSANIGYRNSVSERDGEFFVASAEDAGRTRIIFHQEKLDVYTQLVQIRPYTYVGTFHRAEETAERIIRIKPAKIDPKAVWIALVVVGQDFIELDTNDSPDPGIHKQYPYGYDENDPDNQAKWDAPQWKDAASIEANCQFKAEEKGKSVVSGTGDLIYFRVGMKSKLPGGATGKPRYGLIALIHSGGNHLIYVRQGEAADYLMRTQDPVTAGGTLMNTRPKAKQIIPFNLTVPDDKRNEKYYDIPVNGGAWTDYPSKGGYFLQGLSRRAYFPVGTATSVSWKPASESQAGKGEVCPPGYRRPEDGGAPNDGFVDGSEIRQSFWLNPKNGQASSSYDNMLRGYIADGYFDRRVMRVPNTKGHSNEGVADIYQSETITVDGAQKTFTIPTLVDEGAEIGYAGMLVYNPNNYASIFIPGNGSRSGQVRGGEVVGTGAQSNLWSSSYALTSQIWYLATGYYFSVFVFDNYRSVPGYEGFSIRCVKDVSD